MTDLSVLSIEDRLALLEAKLGVGVAPLVLVPPITVGSLTNVPTPGSQIAAQWAQDVTSFVVHRFPTKTALTAWAAPVGAFAVQTDNGILWRRVAAGWAQQTPWQGTGIPAANTGTVAGSFGVNTLAIPADAGLRVATLNSFTRVEKTNSTGVLVEVYLSLDGTVITRAQINTTHGDVSVPWGYYNIALCANVVLSAGAAHNVAVSHYVNNPFVSVVPAQSDLNRLDALVTAKGY